MNLLKLTLSILTCSVMSSTFAAADYYVKVGGAGSMDGTSWANAFGDLQQAINTASADDEIWVATGTYVPSHDNPRSGKNTARDVTFYIDKNIKIYGGFQGNIESFLSQRDLKNNPVTLSGDLGVDGSAYHVLYIDGSTNPIATSCLLDGFHIVGGSADGSVPDNVGGGILIDGAGMGGQAKPTIRNCIFQDNTAQSGGAIFSDGFDNGVCSPHLQNCLFTANHATYGGGAMYNHGFGGESKSNYDNCTFSKNTATADGPAIFNDGRSGGVCELSVNSCIIWANGLQHDIYNLDATTTMTNSILDDGTPDAIVSTPGVNVVVGTLDEDPLFSDPGLQDFTLQLCSPAIDRGGFSLLSHDICGNTRTFPSVVDMGAYENIQVLCPASGQPIYVDQDVGVCIGTTWDNAHANLQNAIDLACQCPGVEDIWVAEGTYVPTQDNPASSENGIRDRTFYMDKPVRIYGGFAGNETDLSQRHIDLHPTVLSGALTVTDSAFHVIVMNADTVNENWVVDGFTIEHGRAQGSGQNENGGAIFAFKSSGIIDGISGPQIANCRIQNNLATNNGGGIYLRAFGLNSGVVSPKISDCQFVDNQAANGGGIAMESFQSPLAKISADIQASEFTNNIATFRGGAIYSSADDIDASSILNCDIKGNKAGRDGGGIAISSVNIGSHVRPLISETLFQSNVTSSLGDGGGLWIASDTCSAKLVSVSFENNISISEGGAAKFGFAEGTVQIINSLFVKNQAQFGGAIRVTADGFISNMNMGGIQVYNSTVAANLASTDGGIIISSQSPSSFDNCIFWENDDGSASDITSVSSTAMISNSIFSPNSLEGMFVAVDTLNKDPLFIDPLMLNYRLLTGSPAINSGIDSLAMSLVDLDDKTRILGPKVDMGAYEFGDPCSEKNTFLHPNFFTADQVLVFETDDCILGTNIIQAGADITYDAHGGIVLDSLFSVEQGAIFIARTDGCP